jgi:hypothetical protein
MPDNLRIMLGGSPSTRVVLALLAVFSIASWVLIVWKWWQFRNLRRDGVPLRAGHRAVAAPRGCVPHRHAAAGDAVHPHLPAGRQLLQRAAAGRAA